jgi:hypothetical protein
MLRGSIQCRRYELSSLLIIRPSRVELSGVKVGGYWPIVGLLLIEVTRQPLS